MGARNAGPASPGVQPEPDPALLAAGWERRFVADARQAQEAAELYRALGFEVLAVPVRPQEIGDGCEGCRLIVALKFQTVYTRRPTLDTGQE